MLLFFFVRCFHRLLLVESCLLVSLFVIRERQLLVGGKKKERQQQANWLGTSSRPRPGGYHEPTSVGGRTVLYDSFEGEHIRLSGKCFHIF